jgi:FkbM family methyltransferase
MAFEPIPAFAEQLAAEFPGVKVHGVALSDETAEATFHIADEPELSGLLRRDWIDTGYTDVTVPVRRLDDMVPVGQRVTFLKVDVEGAKAHTLRGARRILAEQHPAIWLEHGMQASAAYATSTADLWNLHSPSTASACGRRMGCC